MYECVRVSECVSVCMSVCVHACMCGVCVRTLHHISVCNHQCKTAPTVSVKKNCNKHVAAALENMAARAPLFSHQKCRTLMAAPQCARRLVNRHNPWITAPFAMKMWRVRRIAAHLPKSAIIPYPDTSCTNQKSVTQFLTKKWCTNLTNCCILFDVYHMY